MFGACLSKQLHSRPSSCRRALHGTNGNLYSVLDVYCRTECQCFNITSNLLLEVKRWPCETLVNSARGVGVERTPRPEESYGAACVKRPVDVLSGAQNIVH